MQDLGVVAAILPVYFVVIILIGTSLLNYIALVAIGKLQLIAIIALEGVNMV